MSVDEIDATEMAKPVKTIYLEVRAENRDSAAVRANMERWLVRSMPNVRIAAHSGGADVVVEYQPTDERSCTHCAVDIKRNWYWLALLEFRGGQRVMLSGEVDKFRGAPERFFARQLADYLTERGR